MAFDLLEKAICKRENEGLPDLSLIYFVSTLRRCIWR